MATSPLFFSAKDLDGFDWRFSFIPDFAIYGASLIGKRFSCVSPWIDYSELSDISGFNVFFESSFFCFPISELEKFKEFLQQVKAVKAVA